MAQPCAARYRARNPRATPLYRHNVIRLLQNEGLLSDERTELLLSWRHSGFSVHNRVRVEPEDQPPQFVRRIAAYSNVSRGMRRKVEAENGEVGAERKEFPIPKAAETGTATYVLRLQVFSKLG